jgi:hypothetical protein
VTAPHAFPTEPLAQIDRLASGDLPEGERRNLLAWLDEDHHRWRACALAFLEAQAWEQAARQQQASAHPKLSELSEAPSCNALPAPRTERSQALRLLAVAALVPLALVAGAIAGRSFPARVHVFPAQVHEGEAMVAAGGAQPPLAGQSHQAEPLVATVSLPTRLGPQLPAKVALPVLPSERPPASESAVSEYVRKQWEKRGFEVVEEVRYLPARLPDGRQVMVPVNKVELKYRGTPVS